MKTSKRLLGLLLVLSLVLTLLPMAVLADEGETPEAPVSYKVTIDDTIENGTVTAENETYAAGDTVKLTVTPAEGYELGSLTYTYGENEPQAIEEKDGAYSFEMPAADVKIQAAFTKTATEPEEPTPEEPTPEEPAEGDSFTVTFVYNDDKQQNLTVTVKSGETVEKPADSTKEGYTFQGWFTVDGTEYDFATPVTANLTLNGTWKKDEDYPPVVEPDPYYYNVWGEITGKGSIRVSTNWAEPGELVTVYVTPDWGYALTQIAVVTDRNKVVYLEQWRGCYYFYMPNSDVYILATFTPVEYYTNPFVDVYASDYYYNAVIWASRCGIVSGTTWYAFDPGEICTRAEMVTFLWRAAGCPEPKNLVNPFTDVPAYAYYNKAVRWAVENGITAGTSATTFSPYDPVTRSQSVRFLYRMSGSHPVLRGNPFMDVPVNSHAYDAINWAYNNGIAYGMNTYFFYPNDYCLRGEIIAFLYRYFS